MQNKQLWILIRNKIKNIITFLFAKNPFTKARIIFFGHLVKKVSRSVLAYMRRSWRSLAVVVPLFLVLYYTLGGYVTNTINKDTSFEIKSTSSGLNFVDAGACLIKREVDDNMWTPNLPFIFPGYVLDNMPSFQTGILHAVKTSVKSLLSVYATDDIQQAMKLLKYPPNVWILSKGENLALAPSSGAQYRKARKNMLSFNKNTDFVASDGKKIVISFLTNMEKDLNKISANLENQVREYSSDYVDFKADEMFYLSQGKIYGYDVLLKALTRDFKYLIVETKQYEKLTSLFKTLEDAVAVDPLIVRNGKVESVMAPNHLIILNYYVIKANYILSQIKENIIRDVQ